MNSTATRPVMRRGDYTTIRRYIETTDSVSKAWAREALNDYTDENGIGCMK